MKKLFLVLIIFFATATSSFAAKIPDNVKALFKKEIPSATFRFDGMIILSDGTLYMPLFPALVKKPQTLSVAKTVPAARSLATRPDIVILNNDFAFLKVLTDSKGRKTVLYQKDPPLEVKTGLLPQDMLVPTGLVIPDNIKGIIGNLQITTANDAGLRVSSEAFLEHKAKKNAKVLSKNLVSKIPQLAGKTLYIGTFYSKNIQVVQGEANRPLYGLAQKGIPYDMESTPDEKFLLVTAFGKNSLYVVSLADEKIIRDIDLGTYGDEIIVDEKHNKAYVSSGIASTIYVVDLSTMTLKQKIKVKGKCEKLYLSDDKTKLFYTDRKTDDLWVLELDNGFITKNIGKFSNTSAIRYSEGKIYAVSRVKNRLAIIDYTTLSLIKEVDLEKKPIDMLLYKKKLYILSADENAVQVFDTVNDEMLNTIFLNTAGFSTNIYRIKNTSVAIVTDTKVDKYCVIDLDKKILLKTSTIEVPISKIVVTPTVKRINGK